MPTLPRLAAIVSLSLVPSLTQASQRELLDQTGDAGTVALDQLSGFRLSSLGGFSFAGPMGVGYQSLRLPDPGDSTSSFTTRTTSYFVAPSLDVFVADGVSVGGLIELASIATSVTHDSPAGSRETSLPTSFSLTILPRVGYMLRLSDRFGIWPRLGVGYGLLSGGSVDGSELSQKSLLVDADVGFIYRANETFFVRVDPQLTLAPVGSVTASAAGQSVRHDTSMFAFSSTVGFGMFWDP